jgi:UDP-GlcNAc:undecaprenyl-phosphate GlcNAc-1-phosphate transferase
MTEWWRIYLLGLTAGLTAFLFAWWYPTLFGMPTATNHRGRRIPVSLGIALTAAVVVRMFVASLGDILASPDRFDLALLVGIGLVFGTGLYDDLQPVGTHGLLTQIRSLIRGRMTSGMLKLFATVAAAALWAWAWGGGAGRFVLTVVVVAGCTNLWNLFDVRPGRALKFGLVASMALFGVTTDPLLAALVFAVVAVLPFDLLELAMLGDSGSTILGFLLGISLQARLSVAGLAVGAAVLVALHVVAETVTLSRVIDATPPLRWFDRLGRLGPEGPGTEARREDSSMD